MAGLLLLAIATTPVMAAVASERENAVQLARDGNVESGIRLLERLRQANPDDKGLKADLVVLYQWAGRDADAVALGEQTGHASLPDYALWALARSLRTTNRHAEALSIYTLLEKRLPQDPAPLVQRVFTLSEDGQQTEARSLAESVQKRFADNFATLMELGFFYRSREELQKAVRLYQRAHELKPDDAGAYRLYVVLMSMTGAAFQATDLARRRPEIFSEQDHWQLAGDRNAELVRWGRIEVKDPADRYLQTDRAIESIRTLLVELPDTPVAAPHRKRARQDLLVALWQRDRVRDVVAEYEQHYARDNDLPVYVLYVVADAYLEGRQPEKALTFYNRALAINTWHYPSRIGKFYAYIESEDYASAREHIQQLVDENDPWLWGNGLTEPQPNIDKLDADILQARYFSYAHQLETAQNSLEQLRDAGPANEDLRSDLALVYRWREWPERALAEVEIARSLKPDDVDLQLNEAETWMALGRYPEARERLDYLQGVHPENRKIEDAAELLHLRDKWLFEIAGEGGSSSGSAVAARDVELDTFIRSPWLADHWRAFLHGHLGYAGFDSDSFTERRAGAGIEYERRRQRYYGEIHRNLSGEAEAGVTLGGAWQHGDHWNYFLRYDSFSTDTPLRARNAGIDAWKTELGVSYRWHESASISASLARLGLSDGNDRDSLLLTGERRLYSGPHYLLTGQLELYAGRATQTGGPYFNPESDASVFGSLINEWITWRRYDHVFRQRLIVSAGQYWQEDFGAGPIGDVRYEHDWQLGPGFSFSYGIGFSSRVYDGDRENRTYFLFSLRKALL